MSRRSLGIVTEWFERGATVVSRMYHQHLSRCFQVHVFARGEGIRQPRSKDDDVHSITWGKHDPINPTYVNKRELVNWLERNGIEVVLFIEQQDWRVIHKLQEALPHVIIGTYVDYYTQATVPLFKMFDFLVCNTQRHYEVFRWHPQCFFVPWGTNLDVFAPATITRPSPGRVVFFHSCGMNPYRKGTELVVKAFAELDGGNPTALVIHTQVALAKYLDEKAMNIIERSDRITVHERTVPAPGLYSLGDVYVYPTRLEGLGLTVIEALASGLPVIASDNEPMNEFVEHGVTGYLVPVSRYVARADGYYWPESLVEIGAVAEAMRHYQGQHERVTELREATLAQARRSYDWSARTEICEIFGNARRLRHELVDDETAGAYQQWLNTNLNHTSTLAKRLVWQILPGPVRSLLRPTKNITRL